MPPRRKYTRTQLVLKYIGDRFELFALIGCVLAAIVLLSRV